MEVQKQLFYHIQFSQEFRLKVLYLKFYDKRFFVDL